MTTSVVVVGITLQDRFGLFYFWAINLGAGWQIIAHFGLQKFAQSIAVKAVLARLQG
ncbi:hypothetical protein SDC9_195217 [bioreactor metagenome]|uniref:Uncharacterized protein n=1 Tax=bioreactor metagenome TaxID=1076179 RepID=A0A645IH30_9ZZZZ